MRTLFGILCTTLIFGNSLKTYQKAEVRENKINSLSIAYENLRSVPAPKCDTVRMIKEAYERGQRDKKCNVHYSDKNLAFKIVDGVLTYDLQKDTLSIGKIKISGTGKVNEHTIILK